MSEVTIKAKSLSGIQKAVSRLARTINVPVHLLPSYGNSKGFGHPHIEVDKEGLHFVVMERGEELKRKITSDPHELLYWVFKSVTFSMASTFELHYREKGKDSRRILFAKQEELLGLLDSSWQKKLETYHQHVLEQHPFDDAASERAQYYGQLSDSGINSEKAWALACEKYPLPQVIHPMQ